MPHVATRVATFASFLVAFGASSTRAAYATPLPLSEAPRQPGHGYSPYEEETLAAALASHKATLDAAPDGKIIEGIDVVRLDVIEPRDPAPEILDVLHTTTKDDVVRREILLAVGDPWVQALADETARNLYAVAFTTSLVIVEAVKGSDDKHVRMLVITKDVWSLRASWNFGVGNGGLENLTIQPTETNIAGTHQTVAAGFVYKPLSYSLGAGYTNPRLDGQRLVLTASANVILNNDKTPGQAEGTNGTASVYRPLYSARTEWGYGFDTAWDDEILRRYIGRDLAIFVPTPTTPVSEGIPDEYRVRAFRETAAVTRSFGWATKDDVSFGAEVNQRQYEVEDAASYNQATLAAYDKARLPTSDTRVGPFAQIRHYRSDYVHVIDYETFALQEDYRVGPDLWLRVYPVLEPLGSTRTFFGTYASAQYTLPVGSGILRAYAESTTEAEASTLSDAGIDGGVHFVSPSLGIGRLVLDGGALDRYRNYLNRQTVLGGDTRLRGYPSGFFIGPDLVTANAEFRTKPVEILSCELGLVAFYDGGDAFDTSAPVGDPEHFRWYQSVGGGLRALFPQLDRAVFRVDVGAPLVRTAGVDPVGFYVTFAQAFGFPTVGDVSVQGQPSTTGALGQ